MPQRWPDPTFGWPEALGWPEVAVVPVTYFCNANCDMCALGELKQRDHLGDEVLAKLFGGPAISRTLRAINFTGGEPTIRRALPKLVARLLDVCPALESISLNSNGMLPTSARTIAEVIDVARARGLATYVFISLDGIGALHDDIRGKPGAYRQTVRTIDQLIALDLPGDRVKLGISATVTRKNAGALDAILDFALGRDLLVAFTYPLATDVYMANQDRLDLFANDPSVAGRFIEFIDRLDGHQANQCPPKSFYRDIQALLRGGRRTAPCIFRRGGFFLEPDGSVRPCWRSSELLFGNVREQAFEEIWTGASRRRLLDTIDERFCSTCPSNCYVGFESGLLDPIRAPTP